MANEELEDRVAATEERIRMLEFLWRISVAQLGDGYVRVLLGNIDSIDLNKLQSDEARHMVKNIRGNLEDALEDWLNVEKEHV